MRGFIWVGPLALISGVSAGFCHFQGLGRFLCCHGGALFGAAFLRYLEACARLVWGCLVPRGPCQVHRKLRDSLGCWPIGAEWDPESERFVNYWLKFVVLTAYYY